jgi:hypothetical protein
VLERAIPELVQRPAIEGRIRALGAGDAPQIILSAGSVIYEFEFLYDRDSLTHRGVTPPPLNVTPVLEDVTLTYSRRPRVLRRQIVDD